MSDEEYILLIKAIAHQALDNYEQFQEIKATLDINEDDLLEIYQRLEDEVK